METVDKRAMFIQAVFNQAKKSYHRKLKDGRRRRLDPAERLVTLLAESLKDQVVFLEELAGFFVEDEPGLKAEIEYFLKKNDPNIIC